MAGFGFAFAVAFMACSLTRGQDVKTNYLPGTDFSKYRTYKWVNEVAGQPAIGGHPDQILDAQIRQSIDSQLAGKGFTKMDSDKADLFVTYQVAVDREKKWTAFGWGDQPWGSSWVTASGMATS